jgi:hypothetical protein
MSIFVDAFQVGIDAGKQALRNTQEIDLVFNELEREISENSQGKLHVSREEMSRKRRVWQRVSTLDSALGPYAPKPYYDETVSYDAIVVGNGNRKVAIAEYEISETGYPIVIKWADREASCWDREALTETLQELLADAATGKTIFQLLSVQDKPGE